MTFTTEFQDASLLEIKIIFILAILHGMNSTFTNVIPFWFKEPNYFCFNSKENNYFECTSKVACSDIYKETFHTNTTFISITSEYDLICENYMYKASLQSFLMVAGFVLTFLAILFPIPSKKKGTFISIFNLCSGLFCLLSSFLKNEILIAACLSITSSSSVAFYMIVYSYPAEIFKKKKFIKIIPSVFTTSWGFFGAIFAFFAIILRDWKLVNMYFCGFPVIVLSIYFYKLNKELMQSKEIVSPNIVKSKLSEFKHVDFSFLKEEKLKTNCLIFCSLFFGSGFPYFGLTLALETISKNIYLTMFLFSLIEGIFSYLAGMLILKYNLVYLTRMILLTVSISLILQIFCSLDTVDGGAFSIFLAIISKAGCEVNFTFILTLLMKMIPANYHQTLFAFCSFSIRLFLMGYPYYIESMKRIGIHPLFMIGIIYLIPIMFLNKITFMEEKDDKEMIEEVLIPLEKIEKQNL